MKNQYRGRDCLKRKGALIVPRLIWGRTWQEREKWCFWGRGGGGWNPNAHYALVCRLLSKHFCLQLFFPKDRVFSLFIKSVNLDLQIVGKYISDTLTSKHTFSITDKHHILCEYYGLVIKYTISHNPDWYIKVGNTPPRLPCW